MLADTRRADPARPRHDGRLFEGWAGQALLGALSGRALVRVALEGDAARERERFAWGARVREVEEAPDGSVWVLEDAPSGRLLRLTPAPGDAPAR